MRKLKIGDHICVSRGLYSHHGIYIGHNQVIHFGSKDNVSKEMIIKTSLEEFIDGSVLKIVAYKAKCSVSQIIERAKAFLVQGFGKYNLATNNCEHFAYFCRNGIKQSRQIQKLWEVIKTTVGFILRSIIKHFVSKLLMGCIAILPSFIIRLFAKWAT